MEVFTPADETEYEYSGSEEEEEEHDMGEPRYSPHEVFGVGFMVERTVCGPCVKNVPLTCLTPTAPS